MPSVDRCEVCSVRLPAVQRKDTRYCGSACRVRASRARRKGRPSTAELRRRWAWSRAPTDKRSWVLCTTTPCSEDQGERMRIIRDPVLEPIITRIDQATQVQMPDAAERRRGTVQP